MGLSPRVRGNPRKRAFAVCYHRSIPACAGEPHSVGDTPSVAAVYPRVCGGTEYRVFLHPVDDGLSPRVRGNQSPRHCPFLSEGSIPACAGEPPKNSSAVCHVEVYPRVCGGTCTCEPVLHLCPGLSPRVRGNRPKAKFTCPSLRSIPACAGEPCRFLSTNCCRPVYPRVCGGTRYKAAYVAPPQGLSPRVRGNRYHRRTWQLGNRSIPACAGEPTVVEARMLRTGVYPRVCGGTKSVGVGTLPTCGLSPRVRGNRRMAHSLLARSRSIPACAGEPPYGHLAS